ncbi:MAG TPA: hypothetical protein VGR37_23460 [Longimicrobiaceae bacterium]|nr:hypothetical protein [Longimicrobiaceae bacterium]
MERDNDPAREGWREEARFAPAHEGPTEVRGGGDGPAAAEGDDREVRRDPWAIRAEDTEPYVALQYVARLFKIVAMVVVVALTAEIVAGVALEGAGALLPLTFDVVRGIVLAAILWGAGDLTLLLIDVGHDVRAARVLLGRMSARSATEYADHVPERRAGPDR